MPNTGSIVSAAIVCLAGFVLVQLVFGVDTYTAIFIVALVGWCVTSTLRLIAMEDELQRRYGMYQAQYAAEESAQDLS